jgi:hypothetical protein
MNKKQITAVQAAGFTAAYSTYEGSASEVKITNLAATRTVHGSGRSEIFGRGHAAPGIEVEYVSGIRAGVRVVVRSQELVSTWAEWLDRELLKENMQVAKDRRLADSKAAAEKAAARLGERYSAATGNDLGYGMVKVRSNGYSAGNRWIPAYKYQLVVDPTVLLAVLGE